MSFHETDEARKSADVATKNKRGRKRKNSFPAEVVRARPGDGSMAKGLVPSGVVGGSSVPASPRKAAVDEAKDNSGCRTGRWSSEEMAFCDKLISFFKMGQLPLSRGVKLNDFLASMLKSKQSRLTKKMKNAKLSSNTFTCSSSHILDTADCREFSELEENFMHSIQDPKERAELKFHMKKEWRDMFSKFSVNIGQPLDADAWLNSIEEMDRRISMARDASRMTRRKLMMGYALCQDTQSTEEGVFIERTPSEMAAAQSIEPLRSSSNHVGLDATETDEFLSALLNEEFNGDPNIEDCFSHGNYDHELNGKSGRLHSSPFLSKVTSYIKRHSVPFEHVDVWVPNYTPGTDDNNSNKCRLSFAGSVTTETEIPFTGRGPSQRLDSDSQFNLLSFGDYSQKFSFLVGCGLPGRVFESGNPRWEHCVQNHQNRLFERAGGACQWGIKTVAAVPLPSPNVGRIVVALYSRHERIRDDNLLLKLRDEFTSFLPTPKWKLVVDISHPTPMDRTLQSNNSHMGSSAPAHRPKSSSEHVRDSRIEEIVNILGEEMPSDTSPTGASHLHGMMSLRLLLLRSNRSRGEEETVRTLLNSFSSYSMSGRPRNDIATMITRDYMFLMEMHSRASPSTHSQFPLQHHQHSNAHANHAMQLTNQVSPQIPSYSRMKHQNDEKYHQTAERTTQMNVNTNNDVFLPLNDTKISFFSLADIDDNFRPDSPTLSPIVPTVGTNTQGDSLSIVSN